MKLHQIAEWLAGHGWSVAPLHGKRALTRWGVENQEYFSDPAPCREAFKKCYTYRCRMSDNVIHADPNGIGIICAPSEVVVLDLDSESAIEWARDKAKHAPEIAQAARVRSPRDGGGLHLYFRQRRDREPLRQLHGGIAKNVDIKATGSLIVAPGSLHRTGRRYELITPREFFMPERLPLAPSFLYDFQEANKPPEWDRVQNNHEGFAGTIFYHHLTIFKQYANKAHVLCPNWQNHSKGDKSGTVLYPANELGGLGKIHCEHASCHGLTSLDYKRIIGETECNETERMIKK